MARLNLVHLPVEIVTTIVDCMYHKDLSALPHVCKNLQHILQPQIYSHVKLTWEDHMTLNPPPLHNLPDTVSHSAEIASAIKTVEFDKIPWCERWHCVPLVGPTLKLVRMVISNMQVPAAD